VERHLTGGAGSGTFNYLTDLSGLVVEGANSVLLTPDNHFMFAGSMRCPPGIQTAVPFSGHSGTIGRT
jgi:hypothetical protein